MASEATTQAQIEELLTDPSVKVVYGMELLDTDDQLIADISNDFKSGRIEHDNNAVVHGTAVFNIAENATTGDLIQGEEWDDVRFRPYATVTGADYYYTWYLGVWVPTIPDATLGKTPVVVQVECVDKLSLLDRPVGDTYVVESSDEYIDAVNDVITASGVTGLGVGIEEDTNDASPSADMVWVLDAHKPVTWLEICNDLLQAAGYTNLATNRRGLFVATPYVDDEDKGETWTFDLSDSDTQIVKEKRRWTKDRTSAGRTNWYRFVRLGMQVEPEEGAGYHTVAVDDGFHAIGGTKSVDGAYTVHDFTADGTLEVTGANTSAEALLVGGGGGGASAGGGAGEYVAVDELTLTEQDHAVVVGAGGTAGAPESGGTQAGSGGNSTFNGLTALGGGAGARANANGTAGGSGGGGGAYGSGTTTGGASTASDGDGQAGGGNAGQTASPYPSGGGGGASAAGQGAQDATTSGSGGAGTNNDITGSSVGYCGGGGGSCYVTGNNPGAATHGGGSGSATGNGGAGTANTGGGGGGGVATFSGAAGGSGRVVVRYLTPTLRKEVIMVDAADQTTLETWADAYIKKVSQMKEGVDIEAGPSVPIWHKDVVKYVDSTASIDGICSVASWEMELDPKRPKPTRVSLEVLQ